MEKRLNEIDNFLKKMHFERYKNPNFQNHISGKLIRMTQINRKVVKGKGNPMMDSLGV